MRENTQRQQEEETRRGLCEPHLKCETFIFLQVNKHQQGRWGSAVRCEAGQDTWTAATFCGGNSISQSNDWASSGSSSWSFGGDVCLGNVSINSFVERSCLRAWPLMTALIPLPLRLAQDDVSIRLSLVPLLPVCAHSQA